MLVVAWMLVALAGAGLVALALRLRAGAEAVRTAQVEGERLVEALAAAQEQLGRRESSEQRRRDELQELKRKLDKAKKRVARAREEQHDESSRLKELERELDRRAGELRSLRAELAARAPASSDPRPSPRPAPVAPAPPAAPPPESEALAAAKVARETAEERAHRADAEAAVARKDAARLRERVRTQDKLYLAIHGELQAKKDRLRQLTEEVERLHARLAILDPPPPTRPAGTTPRSGLGTPRA